LSNNQGPILGADVVQGLLDKGAIREDQAQRLSPAPQQPQAPEVPATPVPEAEAPEVPPMLARQPEPQAPEMIARPEDLPDAPEPGVDFGVNLDPREIAGEAVMDVEARRELKAKEVNEQLEEEEPLYQRFEKYLDQVKSNRWQFSKEGEEIDPSEKRKLWKDFVQNEAYEKKKQERIKQNEKEELDLRINEYKADLKTMIDQGYPEDKLPRDPELDAIIAERAKASEAREVANVPTEEEVKAVAEVQKKDTAEREGVKRAQIAEAQARQNQIQEGEKAKQRELEEVQKEVEVRTPADVFGNATTAGKILMLIAAASSGIAYQLRGGRGKTYIDRIQEQIDKTIAEKRLSEEAARKEKLAAYEMAIKMADRQAKSTKDAVMLQNAMLTGQKLRRAQLREQASDRVLAAKRAGVVINPADLDMASPEVQERIITVPDALGGGKILIDSGKDRNELIKSLSEAESAYRRIGPMVQRAQNLTAAEIATGQVGLSEEVAVIQTELKSLVGALRIPFTGPGVLTDTEFARLEKAIGDPTSLASMAPAVRRVQIRRLKAVESILKTSMRASLAARGANIKLTPQEQIFMKTRQKLKDQGLSEEKISDWMMENYPGS
jgi:hypothetical protein